MGTLEASRVSMTKRTNEKVSESTRIIFRSLPPRPSLLMKAKEMNSDKLPAGSVEETKIQLTTTKAVASTPTHH